MPSQGPSNTLSPGKFNVWTPNRSRGAYVAFDTLAEAQVEVQKKVTGVILNPAGQLDPRAQFWSGWSAFKSRFPSAPVVLNPAAPIPGTPATPGPRPGQPPVYDTTPSATPTRPSNQFSVWIPQGLVAAQNLTSAGKPFTNGAFLKFKTLAEAQAQVQQTGVGVVLEPSGAVAAKQLWAQAVQFSTQLLNGKLTPAFTAEKFGVWYPPTYLPPAGVTQTAGFPHGAYLAFDTLAEAQAHAKAGDLGVVLNPKGAPEKNQPWRQGVSVGAQVLNANLKPAIIPGKYNLWFPQMFVGSSLGLTSATGFTNGAFLAFDSLAEAEAHAKLRPWCVILDPKGAMPAKQIWSSAGEYVAQLTNPQLQPAPTAGKFSVWFPQSTLGPMGVTGPGFTNGAYLSFKTLAEAVAHEQLRGQGVILDSKGAPTAHQPWGYAAQCIPQLANVRLTPTNTAGKYSVWFPFAHLLSIGVMNQPQFTAGAYLSFATAAEAQAEVKVRGSGVILDPKGAMDGSQIWNQAAQFAPQLANAELKPALIARQYNVWFPQSELDTVGVDPNAFLSGAYLPFKTLAEAQNHVTQRGLGVILDPTGTPQTKQIWDSAPRHLVELSNVDLEQARINGKYNVWYPCPIVSVMGINPTKFPNGAYLPFDSLAQAQASVTARDLGLVFDANGRYDPAAQRWTAALSYAPPSAAVWPPPAPVGDAAPISTGNADVLAVYGHAQKGGAEISIRTHGTKLTETLTYQLYLTVNGSEMKVKDLGSLTGSPTSYVLDARFDIDYAELTALVSAVQPGALVAAGTPLGVKVTWPSGHDQGAGGAGGGNYRIVAP